LTLYLVASSSSRMEGFWKKKIIHKINCFEQIKGIKINRAYITV